MGDAEGGARPSTGAPIPFSLPPWLREHLPLAATALVFAYLAIRLSWVSRFNFETVRALVASASVSTVVVAGLVPAVIVAWAALLVTMTAISIDLFFIEQAATPYHVVYFVLLAGALVVVPAWWLLVILVMGIVYLLASVSSTRRHRAVDPSWKPALHREGEIELGVVFFLLAVFTAGMWLPAERFTFNDGQSPVVGYWIGEDSHWVTLLTETDRRVIVVPLASVSGRLMCVVGDEAFPAGRPLAAVVKGSATPNYPPCFAGTSTPGSSSSSSTPSP